jgi:hypothetical protein
MERRGHDGVRATAHRELDRALDGRRRYVPGGRVGRPAARVGHEEREVVAGHRAVGTHEEQVGREDGVPALAVGERSERAQGDLGTDPARVTRCDEDARAHLHADFDVRVRP